MSMRVSVMRESVVRFVKYIRITLLRSTVKRETIRTRAPDSEDDDAFWTVVVGGASPSSASVAPCRLSDADIDAEIEALL